MTVERSPVVRVKFVYRMAPIRGSLALASPRPPTLAPAPPSDVPQGHRSRACSAAAPSPPAPARRARCWSRWPSPSLGVGLLLGRPGRVRTRSAPPSEFARAWEKRRLRDDARADRARGRSDRALARGVPRRLRAGGRDRHGHVDRRRRAAARTATTRACPVTVQTRVFGTVRRHADARGRRTSGSTGTGRSSSPACARAERLSARRPRRPPRAAIAARDGREIVTGPADARALPSGDAAARRSRARSGRPRRAAERADLRRARLPRGHADRPDRASSGRPSATSPARPGGRLQRRRADAGHAAEPREAEPVRTTIDLDVQQAAVHGARRAASAASRRSTRRPARCARSPASRSRAPQPPGSTFKIITTVAALEASEVKPSTQFPVETKAVIDGVDLENANGESCGGNVRRVVRALVQLGVRAARREGRGRAAGRDGRAVRLQPARRRSPARLASTLPARRRDRRRRWRSARPRSARARCSRRRSQMAIVAQTIAADGVRRPPTLVAGAARAAADPRDHREDRPPGRADDGRRGPLRHRHARRRSTAPRWPARPAPPSSRTRRTRTPPSEDERAARLGHRRLVRRLRADQAGRSWRWACCSCRPGAGGETAAPAARQVRRWPQAEVDASAEPT